MKILHKGLTALLIATSYVHVASAEDTSFDIPAETRTKIEAIVAPTGASINYFQGPAGTIGVGVSMAGGKQMVVYASKDGSTMFSGVAIDTKTGENITRRDLENEMPEPDFTDILEMAKQAKAITDSDEGVEDNVYVYIDPFCGYCHKTYELVTQLVLKGEAINVHWIPVGILGPKSENTAKALMGMEGSAGREALHELMQKEPGIMSREHIEEGDAGFMENMATFRKAGFSGVPAVVVQRGEEVRVITGMPTVNELRPTEKVAQR